MATLPKNIYLVTYKNQDGSKVLKYQVKYQKAKANFKTTKLFDELETAVEYLNECKSQYGRQGVKAESRQQQALNEYFKAPPLSVYLDKYFNYRYEPEDRYHIEKTNENWLIHKRNLTIGTYYRTLKTTEIEVVNEDDISGNQLIALTAPKFFKKKVKFGDLKLHEVTYKTINSYIVARLATGVKKSTVLAEISKLSSFYINARHIPTLAISVLPHGNPCKDFDKALLNNFRKPTGKRLSNENWAGLINFFSSEKIDPEFSYIALLSLYTGSRRSELLKLKVENIYLEEKIPYILLVKTKTQDFRTVTLTKEAVDLLQIILEDRKDKEYLFDMKLSCFERGWQRYREKFGFETLNFHHLRKEAISRLVDRADGNESNILLAKILGFSNVRQFTVDYIDSRKPKPLDTLDGVMKNVGHGDVNVTSNSYYEIKKD